YAGHTSPGLRPECIQTDRPTQVYFKLIFPIGGKFKRPSRIGDTQYQPENRNDEWCKGFDDYAGRTIPGLKPECIQTDRPTQVYFKLIFPIGGKFKRPSRIGDTQYQPENRTYQWCQGFDDYAGRTTPGLKPECIQTDRPTQVYPKLTFSMGGGFRSPPITLVTPNISRTIATMNGAMGSMIMLVALAKS